MPRWLLLLFITYGIRSPVTAPDRPINNVRPVAASEQRAVQFSPIVGGLYRLPPVRTGFQENIEIGEDPRPIRPADRSSGIVAEQRRLNGVERTGTVGNPPETLEQAWHLSLAVNQRLAAKRSDTAAADEMIAAASAQRGITWGVNSAYALRDNELAYKVPTSGLAIIPGAPLTIPFRQADEFSFRSVVELPIYTHGRITNSIDAAHSQRTASNRSLEANVLDLKMEVAETYLAVLGARQERQVALKNHENLRSHLETVQQRYRQGFVPQIDVLAADVSYAQAQQNVSQAETGLRVTESRFNRLMGRPLEQSVHLAEPWNAASVEIPPDVVELLSKDPSDLLNGAIPMRSELDQLAAQAASLDATAASRLATYGPQVAARGEYAFEQNEFRTPQGIAQASVGLDWKLGDSGSVRHEVNALRERARAIRQLRMDLEQGIGLEVRSTWLELRNATQRLEVARHAVRHGEENLRIARQRYVTGIAVNTEVLDAVALSSQADRNYFQSTYDVIRSKLRLLRALGQL